MVAGGSIPVASESKNSIMLPATVWAHIDGAPFNPRNMKFKLVSFKKALEQAAPIVGCYAPMNSPIPTLQKFAGGDPERLTPELKEVLSENGIVPITCIQRTKTLQSVWLHCKRLTYRLT